MVKEIEADRLIDGVSKRLEAIKEIEPPEWAKFTKTGVSNERPPSRDDWWYVRSASILRRLSLGRPVGVSRMRKAYGGRKRRGHKPEHKYPASGSVIREIFKQLETAGLIRTEKEKGRMITAEGRHLLKEISKKIGR